MRVQGIKSAWKAILYIRMILRQMAKPQLGTDQRFSCHSRPRHLAVTDCHLSDHANPYYLMTTRKYGYQTLGLRSPLVRVPPPLCMPSCRPNCVSNVSDNEAFHTQVQLRTFHTLALQTQRELAAESGTCQSVNAISGLRKSWRIQHRRY